MDTKRKMTSNVTCIDYETLSTLKHKIVSKLYIGYPCIVNYVHDFLRSW